MAITLKELYKLGYFENIEAYTRFTENGIDLVFVFKELPVVQKIEFEGNKAFSDEELLKEIGIETEGRAETGKILPFATVGPELARRLSTLKKGLGRVFSVDEINQIIMKIKKVYEKEGYYNVKVSYYFKGNTLVFKIDEGEKAYIDKIIINGNKHLSDREIKSVMEIKERNLFFLRFHPRFDRDVLYEDLEAIKQLYIDKGFLEVEIDEPIVELKEGEKYIITINIEEGPRYRIKKVELKNNIYYTDEELFSLMKKPLKPGMFYDGKLIRNFQKVISDKYAELGFIFANVKVEKLIDRKKKEVIVDFNINPGTRFYVDKINISGNYESRDYVIRREIRLAPGDLFLRDKLMRSYSRLYGLGFYDMVNFQPQVKSEKDMDLNVQVAERFTGQISLGAGYSQLTGFSLFGSIRKGNFLGTGDTLGISLSIGSEYRNNELSYLHKWAFYKPVDLGFSIYDRRVDYGTFISTRQGVSTNVSYEFKEYWRTGVGLSAVKGKYSNIQDAAPDYIKRQAGSYYLYSIYTYINRNSVDNPIMPTRGTDFTLTFKTGTGTWDFYKFVFNATAYFPDKYFHTDFVFSFRLRYGYMEKINKEVPIDELFFVGGDFTIRGFDYGMAGPYDTNLNPLGSKQQIVLNYQLSHPVVERFLWAYAFTDMGKGFDRGNPLSDLFYSVGVGIKLITPMAPIDIYYGKVLNAPEGISDSRLGFVLGTFF